jgi:hypothetical protein
MIIVVPQVIILYQHTAQELFKESAEERGPFVFVKAVLFGFVLVNGRRTLFVHILKGARRSVDRPAPEILWFLPPTPLKIPLVPGFEPHLTAELRTLCFTEHGDCFCLGCKAVWPLRGSQTYGGEYSSETYVFH